MRSRRGRTLSPSSASTPRCAKPSAASARASTAYRFAAKLRAYSALLDSCIARVLDRLHRENPDMGPDLAIDAGNLPAYATDSATSPREDGSPPLTNTATKMLGVEDPDKAEPEVTYSRRRAGRQTICSTIVRHSSMAWPT